MIALGEYAEGVFNMLIPSPDVPVSALHQLQMVEKSTGKTPEELKEYYSLECPDCYINYWHDFLELNRQRIFTENGPCALSYRDLEAWAFLFDIKPTQHQVNIIFFIDSIWLKVYVKKHKK